MVQLEKQRRELFRSDQIIGLSLRCLKGNRNRIIAANTVSISKIDNN